VFGVRVFSTADDESSPVESISVNGATLDLPAGCVTLASHGNKVFVNGVRYHIIGGKWLPSQGAESLVGLIH
jgi:hypothetical protein